MQYFEQCFIELVLGQTTHYNWIILGLNCGARIV